MQFFLDAQQKLWKYPGGPECAIFAGHTRIGPADQVWIWQRLLPSDEWREISHEEAMTLVLADRLIQSRP